MQWHLLLPRCSAAFRDRDVYMCTSSVLGRHPVELLRPKGHSNSTTRNFDPVSPDRLLFLEQSRSAFGWGIEGHSAELTDGGWDVQTLGFQAAL